MEEMLQHVKTWLLEASKEITEPYFQIPVAGGNNAYRERVYCYELYHQWRVKWDNRFTFLLCGELDKRGHTLVKGKHLDNTIPDFLVHTPGEMNNLLVMEVKFVTGNKKKMAKDLVKLTAYRRDLKDKYGNPANYHAAYFLVYGLSEADWPTFSKKIIAEIKDKKKVDLSLIQGFVHSVFNGSLVEVAWPNGG